MKSVEFEIEIEYRQFNIINKKMVLTYDMYVHYITEKKPEKKDIQKRIEKLIPPTDREYMSIYSFSKNEAKFVFDEEKWFKEVLHTSIQPTINSFEKKLKIGKLPSMILQSVNFIDYIRFVEGSFRNYINKNTKIKSAICNSMQNQKELPLSYFHITYDGYFGYINISLKPEFRTNPMLLTPAKNVKKDFNFDDKVKVFLNLQKVKNRK